MGFDSNALELLLVGARLSMKMFVKKRLKTFVRKAFVKGVLFLVYNNNNNLVWDDRTVLYSINDNNENFKWEILLKTKQIFGESAGV